MHRFHHRHHRSRFTGYVVEGRTSTFGYLTGDSEGQTADGGNDQHAVPKAHTALLAKGDPHPDGPPATA